MLAPPQKCRKKVRFTTLLTRGFPKTILRRFNTVSAYFTSGLIEHICASRGIATFTARGNAAPCLKQTALASPKVHPGDRIAELAVPCVPGDAVLSRADTYVGPLPVEDLDGTVAGQQPGSGR